MNQGCLLALAVVGVVLIASARSLPAVEIVPPSPQHPCSTEIDIASLLPGGAHQDPDVARANAEIDKEEASAMRELENSPPSDFYQETTLLGKLELFDKNLSAKKNLACTSCHLPSAGFTGASSLWNQTIVASPGSSAITNAESPEPNYRISARKPQSYPYVALAPILHYNAAQKDFYGGNFWDLRATGTRLGNPAAEQAQGPPVNPLEMGFSDSACFVYRVCTSKYASLFKKVWGAQSCSIKWPSNVASTCGTPSTGSGRPTVDLNPADRLVASAAFDRMAMSIAQEESSPRESAFTSKFDYVLAGKAKLSPKELEGQRLFDGKAQCNQCHLDGLATRNSGRQTGGSSGAEQFSSVNPADVAPLFTDFTANNIGIPKNYALPYFCENKPDSFGYTANPAGVNYVDQGVGAFLDGKGNPNSGWTSLASDFNGKFQTATLRDVDRRPRSDFVKAYMHNGYLKSLKEVVHFYNTSQSLPHCPQGSPGEKKTCWPEPEVPANLNTTQVGNLGLGDQEEDAIVSFLETLTDGFNPKSETYPCGISSESVCP